jgi:hypothetical protein
VRVRGNHHETDISPFLTMVSLVGSNAGREIGAWVFLLYFADLRYAARAGVDERLMEERSMEESLFAESLIAESWLGERVYLRRV